MFTCRLGLLFVVVPWLSWIKHSILWRFPSSSLALFGRIIIAVMLVVVVGGNWSWLGRLGHHLLEGYTRMILRWLERHVRLGRLKRSTQGNILGRLRVLSLIKVLFLDTLVWLTLAVVLRFNQVNFLISSCWGIQEEMIFLLLSVISWVYREAVLVVDSIIAFLMKYRLTDILLLAAIIDI